MSSDLLKTVGAGAGIAGAVALALWGYLRLGWRAAAPIVEAYPPTDAGKAAVEALRRFRVVKKRAWSAVARGTLLVAIYAAIVLLLGGGVFAFAAQSHFADFSPTLDWWTSLSVIARYAGYFVVLGLVACFLIALVFHCRLVLLVREGKSTRWRALSEELDRAIGHGGILATVFFGGAAAVVAALWFLYWGRVGSQFGQVTGLSMATGTFVGLAVGAAAAWGILLCVMFTFPVLAIRDPGWLSGVEASIGLMALRRRETWRAGLWATLMTLTVYYWPAALWMLLDIVDDQIFLITVLLRERQPREVMHDLEEQAPAQEVALKNADELFQNGRYLDALNLYQMFHYKNQLHTGALEGIARAQLAIGDRQKAKESLERLLLLESANPGGVRMMSELQQGLWDDAGPLYQEAQRRCTQHLGKGVELRDTLDPELLKQFEEE